MLVLFITHVSCLQPVTILGSSLSFESKLGEPVDFNYLVTLKLVLGDFNYKVGNEDIYKGVAV